MFIPESIAKTKFCPMMRAVMPLGSGKFAGGNNMNIEGRGLTCAGTGCMMWQQVASHTVETKEKCSYCKAKEPEMKDCEHCKGGGYVLIQESIGSCGLIQLGTALHVERLGASIDILTRLAMAEKNVAIGPDGQPVLPKLRTLTKDQVDALNGIGDEE